MGNSVEMAFSGVHGFTRQLAVAAGIAYHGSIEHDRIVELSHCAAGMMLLTLYFSSTVSP